MDNFPDFDGADNIPGLQGFNFIPFQDVDTIPDADDGLIDSAITLEGGKQWFTGYSTIGTLSYKEIGQKDDNGDYYEKELSGYIPKDSQEIRSLLDEMENYFFIIDYTDNNGNRKIIGSTTEPLSFKSDLNIDAGGDGKNGHNFIFSGSGIKKSYFYSP